MYPMLPSHSTQHNAHLLGNPLTSMRDLPEHTKRLLFAQAMLNKQRVMNDECERLIRARRVDLLKRRDVKRREALEARALEEDLARRGAEVDKTLGDAERTMNAKRGFRNVARHLSSMRNLSRVDAETERKEREKNAPAKSSFARSKRLAQANAFQSARKDANGYVDLRPEPPLPPVPKLLSLEKNPVVPDEKHVYAVTKRKPSEKKASEVREAALAAAAVAGDDAVAAWREETRTARDDIEAFARAYDDDEFPDKRAFPEGAHEEDEDETETETENAAFPGGAPHEAYVRYRRRAPHNRWDGAFDSSDDEDETETENAAFPGGAPHEAYVRYRRRAPHNRWDGAFDSSDDEDDPRDVRRRERDRLEAAAETHALRLEKDAQAASSVGKFTKAEHHLRQLVALRVAKGGGPRVVRRDVNVLRDLKVSKDAASPTGSGKSVSVDPVDAARALVLLARAVTAQRDPRRLEEVEALFARAAAALAAENGDDDAGVAADSDAHASTRLAALDGLSAACAAFDSATRDDDALRYARRALAYAEKRFGPWDLRVARSARTAAARWLRVGGGGDGGGHLSDGTRFSPRRESEPILREGAGVATATAIDLLRDALEVIEKALGKNHALAIETLCELAAAHKRAGDFPRARRIDEERARRRRSKRNGSYGSVAAIPQTRSMSSAPLE